MDHLSDHGYPKLAKLMSAKPSTAIFRRFSTLSVLNVLRMQAELQDLEYQLWKTIEEDIRSNNKAREGYSSDFRLMRDWVELGDSEQSEMLDDIAKKLGVYSKTRLHLNR
jgi:hypothetical protein